MSAAWVVRATEVGLSFFEQHGVVALNCRVRVDVTGVPREEIARCGPRPALAAQLVRLLAAAEGDLVVATDSGTPGQVLVGTVAGPYRYDPSLEPDHPHIREVRWHGRRRRDDLKAAGVGIPGIAVTAIGPLEVPDDVRQRLITVPPTRTGHPTRARRRPMPAPVADGGRQGLDLVAVIPRRVGLPVSWRDPVPEPEVPCDHPGRRCERHTRHRYWLEVPLRRRDDAGPNVLVVGANPTCPDEAAAGNTTFARVRALGEELGAATLGMVNLATRRTHDVATLAQLPPSERVGPRQEAMLRAAFGQADLVVLAPGKEADRLLVHERQQVERLLADEMARGLAVLQPVGIPAHPMRWPTARPVGGGTSALVQHLQPWREARGVPSVARTGQGADLPGRSAPR